MSYLKYTPYIYLVSAIFFTFKAVEIWNQDNDQHYVFLVIAVLSVFMFLFRKRFAKNMEDRNNKS